MRLRLKFKKEGPIRFVGHLDLMRTMQKTFRRACIPIAYSEGFNPHQVFSFATALAVGVSSEAEYMDLKLTETVPVEMVMVAINAVAPPGIVITEGVVIEDKEPKAMAVLTAAKYLITQRNQIISAAMVTDFLKEETMIVKKKNKKGKINDFDLKPGVIEISVKDNNIHMLIATGSALNIKPEMILTFILDKSNRDYDRGDFDFHRLELYHEKDGLQTLIVPKLG